MRPGFTGKAIPGYQARVTDADGAELGPGTPGFLAVKGPTDVGIWMIHARLTMLKTGGTIPAMCTRQMSWDTLNTWHAPTT